MYGSKPYVMQSKLKFDIKNSWQSVEQKTYPNNDEFKKIVARDKKRSAAGANALDTLAQLPPDKLNKSNKKKGKTRFCPKKKEGEKTELNFAVQPVKKRKDIMSRARQKYFTNGLVYRLVNKDSPLKQSYWNTHHCANNLYQEGKKLSGRYCNARWCMVCNRIRTANLMNGYLPLFWEMKQKYFVTLTIPNVKAEELDSTIIEMIKQATLINRNIREKEQQIYTPVSKEWHLYERKDKRLKFMGIRKTECTYNAKNDSYHPHFHFIFNNQAVAHLFVQKWLERWPQAVRRGQDIQKADNNATKELFKYFTKVVTKSKTTEGDSEHKIYTNALDVIFRAMIGKRVFQPLGLKKIVSEDIQELQSEIFDLAEDEFNVWNWSGSDWVDAETGECLSGYTPSEEMQNLHNNLI